MENHENTRLLFKLEVGSVKGSGQEVSLKQPFSYGQSKRTSHKDLSPASGVNISTQFFNNPYNSTKNRSNSRSNNISPLNRFISPKVMGPQESKIGQKRAQSSCRPSINNPNNFDGSLFSVLDQFKMSPQLPLNLGKSQEFSQQLQQQKQQQNQPQKRKIRILRQSIGSRQATRNDDPIMDEYEYLNMSNTNFMNTNFMDQTPVSKKSQSKKENQQFSGTNNQQAMRQSHVINNQPPMISPNNIGDGYFKNSMFQTNTPISVKTPNSYTNANNSTNPVIIRNNINNISVQIANCGDMNHSFKLSNKNSKDHQKQNHLYDFNLDNIDSPGLQTEQAYRIETNTSDDRINTQTTNKDNMNKTNQISTNNSKVSNQYDYNATQDDRQSRIYALQNYLKNSSISKYQRNSRRGAAHSTHTSNQVKAVVENNLIHSESKYSKNSTTVSNFNTNNITKISDENQNPENQQTIKKQLNCIQVSAPQSGSTAIPRNQSPITQKMFQKFDQNIQILGQTDPRNIKMNKQDNQFMNSCLDPTIQQTSSSQNSGLMTKNKTKMQQPSVSMSIQSANTSSSQPQYPQDINNQDVEELHFSFVEFQQKCKEWLKKIEI